MIPLTSRPLRWRGGLSAIGIVLAACATPIDADHPKVVRNEVIDPYDMREECLHLAEDERLDFAFTATEPVDFNIRYHEGNAVVAPVVRERSLGDSGIFAVRIAQDYCLTWEAGPAGAVLDYRIRLRAADR